MVTQEQAEWLGRVMKHLSRAPDGTVPGGEFYLGTIPVIFSGELIGWLRDDGAGYVFEEETEGRPG